MTPDYITNRLIADNNTRRAEALELLERAKSVEAEMKQKQTTVINGAHVVGNPQTVQYMKERIDAQRPTYRRPRQKTPVCDGMLNSKQAAEILGIPVNSIQNLLLRHGLPFHKKGARNMFAEEEIEQWLKENKQISGGGKIRWAKVKEVL